MKKVLITGSLGYIGSMLSGYLQNRGYDCIGYDTGFFKDSLLYPQEETNTIFIARKSTNAFPERCSLLPSRPTPETNPKMAMPITKLLAGAVLLTAGAVLLSAYLAYIEEDVKANAMAKASEEDKASKDEKPEK